MGIVDRFLLAVSPQRAERRIASRIRARLMMGYEAARVTRRNRQATGMDQGPNASVGPYLYRLRRMMRRLVRDNPYAARIVDILTSHRVGYGFTPISQTGDEALDEQVLKVWDTFTRQSDVAGVLTLEGQIEQLARSWAEAGEGVARWVRLTPGQQRARRLQLPLQLECVEPDLIDVAKTERLRTGSIVQGIEMDATGRRVAFHMHRSHPDEYWTTGGTSFGSTVSSTDRWPASEVLHLFTQLRPGQQRGVPVLAPVALRLNRLDEYEDAALEKAKIEACLAVFVTSATPSVAGTVPAADAEGEEGLTKHREEEVSPGMINYLEPGEDAEFLTPSGAGQFEPLAMHFLMSAATGSGTTYDQVTGDLRGANFSSLKAGKIEFRRGIDRDHWLRIIPMTMQPIWDTVMSTAIMAGLLPPREGGYPVEWMPPAHEMVDPTREMPARLRAVRGGAETMPQLLGSLGIPWRKQIRSMAEWNAAVDKEGMILDTDPRRTSMAGGAQDAKQNAAVELSRRDDAGSETDP